MLDWLQPRVMGSMNWTRTLQSKHKRATERKEEQPKSIDAYDVRCCYTYLRRLANIITYLLVPIFLHNGSVDLESVVAFSLVN